MPTDPASLSDADLGAAVAPCLACGTPTTRVGGPVVLNLGGGLNSTAMAIEWLSRGLALDLVVFADTGGEHDETYAFIREFNAWLRDRHDIGVTVVHNALRPGGHGPHGSLEEECFNNRTLPSKAFGMGGCSTKWKRQPMDRYLRQWQPALDAWAKGQKVTRLLGIDAGEAHRSQALCDYEHDIWVYRRPLVEWDVDREGCEKIVRAVGITPPRKSACWFCPAAKKSEVLALARERPDLFKQAVQMERVARDSGNLTMAKGLGRSWSWDALAKADEAQMCLFPEVGMGDCMCNDGADP